MQRRAYPIPFSTPSLQRLRSADMLIPVILALAVVLPLLLAFGGVGIRTDLETPVVINELFVTPQDPAKGAWVELYNNTDDAVSVEGWKLGNATGDLVTLTGSIAPRDYLVIEAPAAWNTQGDAVILRGVDSSQIDSVTWGAPPAQNPIVDWKNQAVGAPKLDKSLIRNPQGFDSNAAKDWLPIAMPPTPNRGSAASLSSGTYRLLFDVTNYVSLIAGFLLWGGFILIGLIAKRFEMLTGQRAFWSAMIVAPIGIVVYNSVQSYAFFTAGSMTNCSKGLAFSSCQQGWAFVPLLVSALAMAYVVYRFYGIARRILEV
jgi:hypothetical protein